MQMGKELRGRKRKKKGLEVPRVGGRRDLRTPQPSPQAPRARTHARPPGQWGLLDAFFIEESAHCRCLVRIRIVSHVAAT